VSFYTFTHASFPSAALEDVKERLFTSTEVGRDVVGGKKGKMDVFINRPISSRKFLLVSTFKEVFESGRNAFIVGSLQPDKPATPTDGIQGINFDPTALYCNPNYEEIEFDCLLKLPPPPSFEWTREPAQRCCPIFVSTHDKQALPLRGPPTLVNPPPPSSPPLTTSGMSNTSSRFSVEFYPSGSSMYVVGETYAALGDGARNLTQKLLQAERGLQFLCAKEGKLGAVNECILGMVFMGTATDAAQSEMIFQSLNHYKLVLPCLWTLQGLGRLLCYQVRAYEPAVESMRIHQSLVDFKVELKQLRVMQEQHGMELQHLKLGQEQFGMELQQLKVMELQQLKVVQEQFGMELQQLKVVQEQFGMELQQLKVGQEQLGINVQQLKVGQELILQALMSDREERKRARACCVLQ